MRKPSRSFFKPFVEGQIDGGADSVGRGERRFQPARLLGQRGNGIGEDRAVGLGCSELRVVVAQLAQRALLGQHFSGKGFAARRRTFDDLLDQAVLERFRRRDRIAADDHLHREFGADRARQALGAAGARQQAELHFGQPEPRLLGGDAVVACQSDFETAAERGAVNGGNDRFRRVLHRDQHFGQAGRLRRLAEFGDVGASNEGAAAAGQHDRLYFRVGDRRSSCIRKCRRARRRSAHSPEGCQP